MKDISEKKLSDYMAEQIAYEILSGRIPGGSQLKQEELAEAFEASRIPIREAWSPKKTMRKYRSKNMEIY